MEWWCVATPVRHSGAVAELAGAEGNAWERSSVAWHAGFWTFLGVTVALLVGTVEPAGPRLPVALGLVLALAVAYPLLGARLVAGRPGAVGGRRYILVAAPVTLSLYVLTPVGAVLLFVLFPHIWRVLPVRQALAVTVVAMATIGAAILLGADLDLLGVLLAVVLVLGGLVVTVLLGVWIGRIVAQSQQRADLLAELTATRAELAELSHDAGVLAERERLAREIHDTLAQGFASILLLVRAIDAELATDPAACRGHLALAERTARENLADARGLVAVLAPAQLDSCTLPAALDRLVGRVDQPGVTADLEVVGDERMLPPGHDVVLLRVTQESLANVRKHADATRIRLRLSYSECGVELEVSDDGRGFALGPDGAVPGFGLGGMRSRVREIGGHLSVRSAPGDGTSVTARLPGHGSGLP